MIGENRMFQVNVLIEILQEEEDCFTVTCPQLGCIFVQEETLSDALFYAKPLTYIFSLLLSTKTLYQTRLLLAVK